jgi:hypothetical protein
VYACLARHLVASRHRLVEETGLAAATVEHALYQLCRAGRAMVEPTGGRYRLRELFAEPLDLATLFAPDPRAATARGLVEAGAATLDSVIAPDPAGGGRREHKALARVRDGGEHRAVAAIDLDGRLRFGQCSCDFFQRNLMSRGPCEHILAARLLLDRHLAGEGGAARSAEGVGH